MHAFHAPGSPGSPGSNRTASQRKIRKVRKSKSVIFALVDLHMTVFAYWDLLSVQHSENAIEAYGLPFVGQFADMTLARFWGVGEEKFARIPSGGFDEQISANL
jgi:hypothetical protein